MTCTPSAWTPGAYYRKLAAGKVRWVRVVHLAFDGLLHKYGRGQRTACALPVPYQRVGRYRVRVSTFLAPPSSVTCPDCQCKWGCKRRHQHVPSV